MDGGRKDANARERENQIPELTDMANYRVKIGSTDMGLVSAVVPVGWDSVLDYKPDADSVAYNVGVKTDVTLNCARLPSEWGGDKPDTFQTLVDASDGCEVFQFAVEVECAGEWAEVWDGEFSSKDWKVDLDKKTITVRPKRTSDADCIRSVWTDTQNPFGLTPVTVKPYFAQYQVVEEIVPGWPWADPCDTPPTVPQFCHESTSETQSPGEAPGVLKTCVYSYSRYVLSGSCSGSTPLMPDTWNPWTILDDDCPTGSTWYNCETLASTVVFRFDNGRMFKDVIEYLVNQTGCGLGVVSDFFDINPDATAPANDAYAAAEAKLHNLVLFQKSDVKRHSASDKSKEPAWDIRLRDVLVDLAAMFNIRWRADAGVFRLEHVSYFEAQAGNDYTTALYERRLDADKAEIVKTAKFRFRDERCTDYFKGVPITTYCGDGEKEMNVTLFSTDIGFMLRADAVEAIGDDGWALMSTYDDDGDLRLLDGNRALSWTEMHDDYHRHQMAGAGEINGAEVTPESIKQTRKAPRFSVSHCCDDTFDPAEYQTTALGNGKVSAAEHNIARDFLTLELLY